MEFERQRSSHPPGHPIVAYVWVADPDAYARAARDITRGIVPVLAPGDPARKRQWARILRWHGLKQVRGKASRAPARARVASDRNNAVVAMDRQSRPVAALYAAALGRPCLAARALGRLRRYDSVLFVGAPSAFTMRRIRAFNRSLTVPWGVLTGKDLPALSFLAAKNLAFLGRAARTPLTGFAIDILHQSIIDAGSPYLFARPGALSAPRARRIVRAREAGVLVLHAHGEGGHANLGSIVLCGQSGGVERAQVDDDGGPALDGCSGSGPARSCKRVHSDTVQVVGFDALRVKRFCFLSCNGFSVSGELYPSDVSAVFGCVEGYPAQVLLNDRPTPVTPEVPKFILGMLRAGLSLGRVLQFKNERRRRMNGDAPYVLVGDPAGAAPRWRKPRAGGVYIAGAGGLLPIALPSGGGKARAQNLRILEARCGQEPVPMLLGDEHAFVALRAEEIRASTRAAKVSVASAREAWKSLQARFILLRRRLLSALDSQLAIRLLFRGAITRDREFALQMDALARSLDALREVVREGICACEEAGLSGVWSERIPALAELASIHVAGIDRQFAQLALNHLFDGPVEEIFADSLGRESCRREKSACPRCRSPLTRTRFKAASGDRDGWTRVDCPTCGFREGWSRRANRLVVKTPARVAPGSVMGVELRWTSGPSPVQGSLPLSFLAIAFKDKGKGLPFFSQLLQTSDRRVKLGFRAPKDLSPDLHSAIAFRAAGLDFGLARVRCAGVPAASKAWFDEQFRRTERN